MRPMNRLVRVGIGLVAVVLLVVMSSATGPGTTAQDQTPEGRLGGGAPLDATIPVATTPPTATPTATASVTATPDLDASPVASPGGLPVASPVASPLAGGDAAPVTCDVAPRALDEVAALLMLAERPTAPPSPTAAEWTPEAEAAARAVVAELVACGDDGRQLAAYALMTDAALVEYLIGSQPAQHLTTIRALFFDEEPSLVPALVTGLETRAQEPGTVYLWLDLGGGRALAVTITVAQERGAWRIAAIQIASDA